MSNVHQEPDLPMSADGETGRYERRHIVRYISLKLAALGLPTYTKASTDFLGLTHGLLRSYKEKSRLLSNYLCPIDTRIQHFLDDYLAAESLNGSLRLPGITFTLDRPGSFLFLLMAMNFTTTTWNPIAWNKAYCTTREMTAARRKVFFT